VSEPIEKLMINTDSEIKHAYMHIRFLSTADVADFRLAERMLAKPRGPSPPKPAADIR